MKYQLFTFVIVYVIVNFETTSAQNTCHLRELDICAASLAVFAQRSTRDQSDTHLMIDRQCVAITDAADCISNFTELCLTETQKQLSDTLFDGVSKLQKEYCDKKSSLRAMYVQHAPCLAEVSKEQKSCLKLFQAGLESVNKAVWNKRIPYLCCTYHRLTGCVQDLVRTKCGDEPLSIMNGLIRATVSRIPDLMCAEHNDNSEICTEVPRTVPEGTRSSSLINRLLSAYANI